VVRADLGELWHLDLQGAPYGYTPFCDSRHETLGYQFWRHGYWKDHLAGKPYHISALYVVDLLAFRRAAVGDQLRSIYDTLSRDPGSLSNLDQDLPNYAQTHIPIHSLPQEWLWCESWCSDESKATSKTIGACVGGGRGREGGAGSHRTQTFNAACHSFPNPPFPPTPTHPRADLCNNPRFKEPKLDMAKRVISGDLFPESWNQLDAEVAANEGTAAAAGGAPPVAAAASAATAPAAAPSGGAAGDASMGLVVVPSADEDEGDKATARRKRRRQMAADASARAAAEAKAEL